MAAGRGQSPAACQHRDGVAVRQRAADANPIRGDGDPALQQRAKALNQRGGPGGKVGQGALSDPAILAKSSRATGWQAASRD
jgi:hypothetical protein